VGHSPENVRSRSPRPRRKRPLTTPETRTLLEARSLVREFGVVRVVDGVSLSLVPGRVLAVFGPNGAGKTTLLKLLAGGLKPTEGTVVVDGHPVADLARSWRRRIGVVSHQSFLYGHLTVEENLRFYGKLYRLDRLEERVAERLEAVALTDRAHSPVSDLSRGLRQRAALARALLHDPEVVLLDEPFTGLDAHAAEVLRRQLRVLRDGRRAVVLVTHNLTEGVQMADDVAIQVRGRWVAEGERGKFPEAFAAYYRDTVDGTA